MHMVLPPTDMAESGVKKVCHKKLLWEKGPERKFQGVNNKYTHTNRYYLRRTGVGVDKVTG